MVLTGRSASYVPVHRHSSALPNKTATEVHAKLSNAHKAVRQQQELRKEEEEEAGKKKKKKKKKKRGRKSGRWRHAAFVWSSAALARIWWRWWDLNPRPKRLHRQYYMLRLLFDLDTQLRRVTPLNIQLVKDLMLQPQAGHPHELVRKLTPDLLADTSRG